MRLAALVLLFSLAGCLKTAEQVKREQRVENMSQQLADSQNIVADLTVALKNLQQQIDQLNGKVEELQHQQKGLNASEIKSLQESMEVVKQQVNSINETQKAQGADLTQQRAFIEKVTEKLGKMSTSHDGSSKKNPKSDVGTAWTLIKKKKYAEAKTLLEGIVEDAEVDPADQNKALHAMGVLEYQQKNYEQGLVYFSKVFTKYPKSSLAPSSLLFIGRSLNRLGKKAEAKQAYEELKSNYPESSAAKEGAAESKKI